MDEGYIEVQSFDCMPVWLAGNLFDACLEIEERRPDLAGYFMRSEYDARCGTKGQWSKRKDYDIEG